jgi:hypothetical protein
MEVIAALLDADSLRGDHGWGDGESGSMIEEGRKAADE